MSIINTQVKPFKATAYQNGKFIELTEASLIGHWSVLVFYPADFTFVCPTELGDLADHYDTFKSLGVEIYGVSTDSHFAHKAWHDSSDTTAHDAQPCNPGGEFFLRRDARATAPGRPPCSRLERPPARGRCHG